MNTKEQVIRLLKDYSKYQRKIALLRYELEHPAQISPDEMLDAMAFARGDGSGRSEGTVSNKTLYIAMNYQQKAERLNRENMDDIVQRLIPLENEINRLDYYVGMLEEKQQEIIRLYFFEKKSWRKISEMTSTSVRRLRDVKDMAVDALVDMYAFVSGSDGAK